ncbi:hypothetical protein CAEBREN_17276 [Caenorhabditis brenneri]|uniref:Uncharacterized protein n=1 Tax=Caenorhabditis brenneri TaxID=135651 RepID=G0P2K1_CAEBE|nr:hypothetical protein CAEBREN_17276 [Caenorhabditis brenneri]
MAEIWIRRLEFNLGTRASREYVFSPPFTQVEHVNEEQRSGIMKPMEYTLCQERAPLNTDIALSLNVVDFMSRRMNKNGRGRYSMDYLGKRCSKEEYGRKMKELGIKAEGMIHKGRNQVGVIRSDEAGNEIQPNDKRRTERYYNPLVLCETVDYLDLVTIHTLEDDNEANQRDDTFYIIRSFLKNEHCNVVGLTFWPSPEMAITYNGRFPEFKQRNQVDRMIWRLSGLFTRGYQLLKGSEVVGAENRTINWNEPWHW